MNKNEEDKLANAIIALHEEIKGLRADTNQRFEKLEKQQAKTNLALGEIRLSYMRMADEVSGLRSEMNNNVGSLRSEISGLRSEMNDNVGSLRSEINGMRSDLNDKIDGMRSDFKEYASSNSAQITSHHTRIARLEEHNFGTSMIAKESRGIYKKRKKKR